LGSEMCIRDRFVANKHAVRESAVLMM
jgi:hypothetical protein